MTLPQYWPIGFMATQSNFALILFFGLGPGTQCHVILWLTFNWTYDGQFSWNCDSLTNIIKLPLCHCVFESIQHVFSCCQIYIVLNDRRRPMVQGFLCTFPNAETFQFQVRNSVPKRHHMGLTLIIHMWHIWTGEIGFQYIRCAFRWVLWFSILFRLIQHDRGWCI